MEIKLHDKYFKPFISAQEIDRAVERMAQDIYQDMGDEIPVFVGVLNGSFMLVSDFVKKYPKPCEVTFIKLASYEGVKSTEDIQRLIGLTQDLKGRTVVVLEDIIDTGNTLQEIYTIFKDKKLKQLKITSNEKTIQSLLLFFKFNSSQDLFYRVGIGSIDNKQLKDFASAYNNSLLNFFKKRIRSKKPEDIITNSQITEKYDKLVVSTTKMMNMAEITKTDLRKTVKSLNKNLAETRENWQKTLAQRSSF